jgi:hypothetical protein
MGKRNDEGAYKAMSARLVRLREKFETDYEEPPVSVESEQPPPPPSRDGELIFITGPRAGERLPVEGRNVALDRDANESTGEGTSGVVARIWTQGEHIMLGHSGAVLIGGTRPTLPIVVLEDGDELTWSNHKLEFRRAPKVGR